MKRRLQLVAATALLAFAALEGFAFAALSVMRGAPTAWGSLRELQLRRASGDRGALGAEVAPIRAAHVLHPFLGYVMDPRLIGPRAAKRSGLDPQSVEFGFPRNAEALFQTPSAERLVVGVFGGSVADLLVGSAGETLSDAIGALPRFAGREVVVLSIAAPGYKQPQQLMALNYLLALGAHFDVVVNIDGFNDLTLPPLELEPFEAFPLFPRGWYPVASRLSPGQRRGQGRVSFLDRQRRDWAEWSRRAPWRWSLTAGLVWAIGDRWLGSRLAAAERELVEAGPTRRDPQAQGPAAERWPEPDRVEVVVAGWRRSSLQMERLCRGLGIEYLHLLQPSQYVPDSKPMSAAERARAWRADSPHRQVVESHWPRLQAAGAALARQGVPFTDLTAMFADVRAPMYGDDCCHLTRAGNERLARAVADALARVP